MCCINSIQTKSVANQIGLFAYVTLYHKPFFNKKTPYVLQHSGICCAMLIVAFGCCTKQLVIHNVFGFGGNENIYTY